MIPVQKRRFPRSLALDATREILAILQPACHRVVVAGSLRRRKSLVGDIEILYIPRTETRQATGTFWDSETIDLAEEAIAALESSGILKRRLMSDGKTLFGPRNKLMGHVATSIPVDLFQSSEASWHNYLVCRTGSAETCQRIAASAKARGLSWNPYSQGFSDGDGNIIPARSEEEVFALAGLPYLEPRAR